MSCSSRRKTSRLVRLRKALRGSACSGLSSSLYSGLMAPKGSCGGGRVSGSRAGGLGQGGRARSPLTLPRRSSSSDL